MVFFHFAVLFPDLLYSFPPYAVAINHRTNNLLCKRAGRSPQLLTNIERNLHVAINFAGLFFVDS